MATVVIISHSLAHHGLLQTPDVDHVSPGPVVAHKVDRPALDVAHPGDEHADERQQKSWWNTGSWSVLVFIISLFVH